MAKNRALGGGGVRAAAHGPQLREGEAREAQVQLDKICNHSTRRLATSMLVGPLKLTMPR